MSIRTKTIVVLLLATLAGLAISGAVYFHVSQEAARQTAINHLRTTAEIQMQRVKALHEQYLERLRLISSRTQLRLSLAEFLQAGEAADARTRSAQQIRRILLDAKSANDDLVALEVLTSDGELVTSTDDGAPPSRIANIPEDLRAVRRQGETWLELSGPLILDDREIGHLVATLDSIDLRDITNDYTGLGASGETIIAIRADDGTYRSLTPLRASREEAFASLTLAPKGSNNLALYDFTDYRGKNVLAVAQDLPGTDWIVFVKRDKAEIFKRAIELENFVSQLLIATVAVAAVLAFFFAETLTRPLVRIAQVTRRIARGDLMPRIELKRRDEIGDLANSVNQMADHLIAANRQLEDLVEERTKKLRDSYLQLESLNVELNHVARHDALTGVHNRRAFDERFSSEWDRASRSGQSLGLLLIDVDHFKSFNDTGGHNAGDQALARVAGILSREVSRGSDMLARYGGEEFAVIAAETDEEGLAVFAERIRAAVASAGIPHPAENIDQLTISIGASGCIPSQEDVTEILFRKADQALYQAKRAGRNRVEVF